MTDASTRAIEHGAQNIARLYNDTPWDRHSDGMKRWFRQMAQAALVAGMREGYAAANAPDAKCFVHDFADSIEKVKLS